MSWIHNDGGRAVAGYKGRTGDCGIRAFAIASMENYQYVYDAMNIIAKGEKPSKTRKGTSNSRTGVHKHTYKKFMEFHGWVWVPTMFVGQGCKVHLTPDELPAGRIVVNLSKHYAAVIDGIVHDTYDCTRDGTRCVYGYWHEGE